MAFTDEQPFLDAIFDRYADDRPRLMYADYLDDIGEPERAELVRVQIALAKLSSDDPLRPELIDRAEQLARHAVVAWGEHLGDLVVSVDFRRGVPDSVSVNATTFVERGDELFRLLRVRRLRLLDAAPVMPKLAACPLLAGVRDLDLCGCELGNGGVNVLVRSPHLKELVALDLGFNGLDDAGVSVLARSSALANLTALALNDNDQITSDGLRALAESPFFAGLTSLDVSGNDINDHGVRAAVTSPIFGRLRCFKVNGNHIGDAGVTSLVRSALFSRMMKADPHVELRASGIGPAGAEVLSACPALAACSSVDLSDNYLGDQGIAALLRSAHLGRLKSLRLGRNQLTDAGMIATRELFDQLFNHLALLDLSGNRLTRVGLGVLAAHRGDRPVRIEVSGNVQSPTGGDAPVAVSDVLTTLIDSVAEAARLKHRVANPRHRNEDS
ncbi:MAG: TIGR02996 domain-containing protein [Planctomycetia bacterium]|nr:TIGR02996 domain-containing protein [Planctomycetia bacterium]